MNTNVISKYQEQLRKLESSPFQVGLPEEIEKLKAHIKTLLSDPNGMWDGDLGCYDPHPTEPEHIDL